MNIAFIPVRCGSKSIPFKNIKEFCGKPLVYWNLEALENSQNIDKIFVATDCEEIKNVIKSFNFLKVEVYDREKQNASDSASTESVMLEFINKQDFRDEDLFFLVQATSPLTQTKDFDEALEKLKNEDADSLLTCVRTKRFFWDKNANPINYDFKNRPRRQDFDGLFMENGAFYINTIFNIKKDRNRLTGKIAIHEMEEFTAVEIDEEDDWLIAEKMMYKYILSKRKTNIKIKLFLSDVDGTLTDAGMYYGENGEEFKKFNTHDGKGFELLRKAGIKTGIITSENTKIVANRAKKLKVDFLYQGLEHKGKLDIAKEICEKENISLQEVAYIGDDINDIDCLDFSAVKITVPNSTQRVKKVEGIQITQESGGNGAFREVVDCLLNT